MQKAFCVHLCCEHVGEYSNNKEFWFTILREDDTGELWHLELEIVFVLKGTGRICFENSSSSDEIKIGDIFAVNSFQMRMLELDKDAQAISLMLSPDFLVAMSSDALNVHIDCKSFLYADNQQKNFDIIRRDFARAFQQVNKKETYPINLKSKISVLLDDLIRLFCDSSGASCYAGNRSRLKAAVDYIQRHYQENVKLCDLEAHTYLSSSYISHCFQKYMGMSFLKYLTQVRLSHAILMLHGDKTITDIAYESGFSTVNSLIKTFNQYKGMTPGEYRRRLGKSQKETDKLQENMEYGISDVFATLMKYAEDIDICKEEPLQKDTVIKVPVDMNGRTQRTPIHWKRVINAGYAKNLINGTIQEEIRSIQQDIGFEYIRCKGILDDEMCLYRRNLSGTPIVNYNYIDEAIDFILSVKAKPMLELGFVPSIMAKNEMTVSMRSSSISAPKDIDRWERLIYELTVHFTDRYGEERVKQWLFSSWSQPDFERMDYITLSDYEQMYRATFRAIKSVCSQFLVCGPGCENYKKYLPWFIQLCKAHDCLPDILTFRCFSILSPGEEENGIQLFKNGESIYRIVSNDEDILFHAVQGIRNLLKRENLEYLPVVLEEWSNNIWQRDYCNDTCYKSAFLFKGILENNEHLNGIGYFSVNDRLDEAPPSGDLFHGGFGLFTKNGIPKSGYSAMRLLGQMGDVLVQKGKGYYITESHNGIQIFLYNYCHYDMLYCSRHTVNISKTDRYRVFNEKGACQFRIQFNHMPSGKYTVKRYSISPAGGSSYDAWVQMGAPDFLDSEEAYILEISSRPSYKTWVMELPEGKEVLSVKSRLMPHEVQLIKVLKK